MLCFCHAKTECWKKPDCVCPGTSGEYVVIEKQTAPEFGCVALDLDTNHETASPDFLDLRYCLKLTDKTLAYGRGVVDKFFTLHYVENGDCGGTGEMIASEGSAEHSFGGFELR